MSAAQLAAGSALAVRLSLAGGEPVAALQAGPSGGPPVLLLPGFTGTKEDFAPILDPLGALGLRVTAIDLPGQYETPGPDDPIGYTPDRLATVVLEISAALGPGVRLLGHSFGGLVARAAVIARPDRFASLVLLSSGPAQLEGARRVRIETLAPILAAAGLPGVYAAMQAAAGEAVEPPELAEFLQRRFLGGSVAMLQGMGDALRHEPDRVGELAATGCPVLVLHGADDDAWPPAVQREMAGRLGARYAVVPDANHSPAVENADGTVAALRDFWAPRRRA